MPEEVVELPYAEVSRLIDAIAKLVTVVLETDMDVAVQVALLDVRDACEVLAGRLDP
jgi:hypothetical protein